MAGTYAVKGCAGVDVGPWTGFGSPFADSRGCMLVSAFPDDERAKFGATAGWALTAPAGTALVALSANLYMPYATRTSAPLSAEIWNLDSGATLVGRWISDVSADVNVSGISASRLAVGLRCKNVSGCVGLRFGW